MKSTSRPHVPSPLALVSSSALDLHLGLPEHAEVSRIGLNNHPYDSFEVYLNCITIPWLDIYIIYMYIYMQYWTIRLGTVIIEASAKLLPGFACDWCGS